MGILMIFIDGFGLGKNDPRYNPILNTETQTLKQLIESPYMVPTSTCMGVEGIPQSATGQTALFTGINAAKAVGRHISGFPTAALKEILKNYSVFKQAVDLGMRVTNANMYRTNYYVRKHEKKLRASATTVATMAAGIPFRNKSDLINGKAVFQDITNEILIEQGYKVPQLTPEEAGRRLAVLSSEYDFTLFEYFQTDIVGHSQDMEKAIKIIDVLDRFVKTIIDTIDLSKNLILITSDHGNIEDLSVKTHTLNKVPTILLGLGAAEVSRRISSLEDITPSLIDALKHFSSGNKEVKKYG
ncbi:MAG: 2,3-bisphosphoglycerate-independent phosphoglycerate mutase [Thermosediminibacterales bacterium]|nr:2,3-bisphosphoglycerate-independent phosphoglycerate mutase [Thermosediminibacterales bacterium]MDK2835473.1 2,3-bisphosphoglycerate-independent phosphoglycerate mutase [Thermosediminibacterales bacterium]